MIGKLFNNRYEIKEKIGSGGTAVVYKGQDILLGRMVTIKILREEYVGDEEFVRRFRREAQAVASLSHGNIVSIYDVGDEGDLHYFVMEFVEGETLKDYIKRKGTLDIAETVDIISQILEGIDYAHKHGIVHRDIKPQNVLISKDRHVKVTDFGIAMGLSEVTQTYHSSSKIMGSVQYISPEQVQGEPVTEKSDIYSIGVVLYEMLTGQLPFSGDSAISVAMQHVHGELIPPHQINHNIPIGLSYVVMRAMRKSPEIRYTSAREMNESVHSVTEGINRLYQETSADSIEETKDLTADLTSAAVKKRSPRKFGLGKNSNMNGKKIITILAIIFLAAFGWMIWQAVRAFSSTADVVVPQVEGKTLTEADRLLDEAELTYTTSYANNNEVPAETVISQSIAAEQKVKKNRNIELVVSKGAKEVEVPPLVGLTRKEAELSLSNRLLVADVTEENSDTVAKDLVISQYPLSGTMVSEKDKVLLKVSLGPQAVVITMPNLIGKPLADVQTSLKEKKIDLGKITYQSSTLYEEGIVIAQSVDANSDIKQGDTVTVTVSDGPGPTEKTTSVSYLIQSDGEDHAFKLVVKDVKGTREIFSDTYAGGTLVMENVTYYNEGKAQVYLDGELVYEQSLT